MTMRKCEAAAADVPFLRNPAVYPWRSDAALAAHLSVHAPRPVGLRTKTSHRPGRSVLPGVWDGGAHRSSVGFRVVELARDGRSNREIVQLLFVTRTTVEWHLSNAFRKLGVVSRDDLTDALQHP